MQQLDLNSGRFGVSAPSSEILNAAKDLSSAYG